MHKTLSADSRPTQNRCIWEVDINSKQWTCTAAPSGEFWDGIIEIKGQVLEVDLPIAFTWPLYVVPTPTGTRLVTHAADAYRSDFEIDPRGVYSMLQFGTIVPPFSPWKQLLRLRPGFKHRIHADGEIEEIPRTVISNDELAEGRERQLSASEHVDELCHTLDRVLNVACPSGRAAVLFSGGVDSGLIAARAAALGWDKAVLVNYAMSPDDPESEIAEAMAREIGLPFYRVVHDEDDALSALETFAQDSPQPFTDLSVFPTRRLSRQLHEQFDVDVVFDGTGADGCFGLLGRAERFQQLYKLPSGLRHLGGWIYSMARIWTYEGRIEPPLRVLRRTSLLPWLASAIAQNPLSGIVYTAEFDTIHDVLNSLEDWIARVAPVDSDDTSLLVADLALVCANVFAQKSQPLFNDGDTRICFPFLDDEMIRVALRLANMSQPAPSGKWILREALARQVSPSLVYRKKVGFVAPVEALFSKQAFRNEFDKLEDPTSFLAPWLRQPAVQTLGQQIRREARMPAQTANLTWAVVALNLWFEQVSLSSHVVG